MKGEDIATCMVDGKILKAGRSFTPAAEPEKLCVCSPGYLGKKNPCFRIGIFIQLIIIIFNFCFLSRNIISHKFDDFDSKTIFEPINERTWFF